MSNIYVEKDLYIEMIRRGHNPKDFVNTAVKEKLEREKK